MSEKEKKFIAPTLKEIDQKIEEKRDKEYKEGTSVFNVKGEHTFYIGTTNAKHVIPKKHQAQLPNEKLKETRMILVVDCIKENVLYLKLTSPKPHQVGKSKYLVIKNVLSTSSKYKNSVIDLDLDYLDYYYSNMRNLKIKDIKITNIKVDSKDMDRIYTAVNSRISNINKARKYKKTIKSS